MVLPHKNTNIQQAFQAAKILGGVDPLVFVCFQCQRFRKMRFSILVGTALALIAAVLILEKIGIIK
ncbi:MAG: hypothetical protein H0X47_02035 [Nitrospirales bacterium]|nr:hypothetical protein [Nitrospirales bacterium]